MARKTSETIGRAPEEVEERFLRAVAPLDHDADVEAGTGFGGGPGRRVHGHIFAMLVHGELVVKLPRHRVADLVASGVARPYDAAKGRPMHEWASVPAVHPDTWPALVREAYAFLSGSSPSRATSD